MKPGSRHDAIFACPYSDVIISAMASQNTGVSIVYSTICSGADQRKSKNSASQAFLRGIRWWPVKSLHKGPVTRKIFPFDDENIATTDIVGVHTTTWRDNGDVIMGAIASQITSLTIVYSTVYSDADQRKHQSSASLAFVRGIHRGLVNSPHKWPVTQKMFPFDDVIMNLQCSNDDKLTTLGCQCSCISYCSSLIGFWWPLGSLGTLAGVLQTTTGSSENWSRCTTCRRNFWKWIIGCSTVAL